MKNSSKFFGIITLLVVVGFSMVSCGSLPFGGGSSGGGGGGSASINLADVTPGNVPQDIVGRWFMDERKRARDFIFEITSDGKYVTESDALTVIAEGGVMRLYQRGSLVTDPMGNSEMPYRIAGNTLYITTRVFGNTVEAPYYR